MTREIIAMGFEGKTLSVVVTDGVASIVIDGHRKIRMEKIQAEMLGGALKDFAAGKFDKCPQCKGRGFIELGGWGAETCGPCPGCKESAAGGGE